MTISCAFHEVSGGRDGGGRRTGPSLPDADGVTPIPPVISENVGGGGGCHFLKQIVKRPFHVSFQEVSGGEGEPSLLEADRVGCGPPASLWHRPQVPTSHLHLLQVT